MISNCINQTSRVWKEGSKTITLVTGNDPNTLKPMYYARIENEEGLILETIGTGDVVITDTVDTIPAFSVKGIEIIPKEADN